MYSQHCMKEPLICERLHCVLNLLLGLHSAQIEQTCEILGSHGGEYDDGCLLGCCTVWSGRSLSTFQRCLLCKESVVAYFNIVSHHLPGGCEEIQVTLVIRGGSV
jgi:hypothetical protein